MSLIILSELKSVLGIGSIYADSIVQECADTAENIVLSYLSFNKSAVLAAKLSANVATYYTSYNILADGQSVIVSGLGAPFDGTKTIITAYADYFTVAIVNADIKLKQFMPKGKAMLASQVGLYDTTPEIREAAMAVAADVFISRQGTLGQQGVDFTPAPYKLGRSLFTRVTGLLGKHIDVAGYCG